MSRANPISKMMRQFAPKIVLNSRSEYSVKHDQLLNDLIDAKVMLFCVIGTDCETWHDVMDDLIVGDGVTRRDFVMTTTWHTDETLEEVIEFARTFHIDGSVNHNVQVIEI